MMLESINGVNMKTSTVKEAVSFIRTASRPMTTRWIAAPSRSLSPDGKKIITEFDVTFRGPKEFDTFMDPKGKSLGIELVQRRGGGVLVKQVLNGGFISQAYPNKIRRGMQLIRVGEHKTERSAISEVLQILKNLLLPAKDSLDHTEDAKSELEQESKLSATRESVEEKSVSDSESDASGSRSDSNSENNDSSGGDISSNDSSKSHTDESTLDKERDTHVQDTDNEQSSSTKKIHTKESAWKPFGLRWREAPAKHGLGIELVSGRNGGILRVAS